AIRNSFGVSPIAYKAGRYGVGEETADLLESFGYQIDLSILPARDLSAQHGPDFRLAPNRPYWFGAGNSLLAVPMTVGFAGALARVGGKIYPLVSGKRSLTLHVPGVLAQMGLLERITLTPEGITLDEMKRLVLSQVKMGHRIFTLTYHSSSLLAGG